MYFVHGRSMVTFVCCESRMKSGHEMRLANLNMLCRFFVFHGAVCKLFQLVFVHKLIFHPQFKYKFSYIHIHRFSFAT